MGGVELWNSTLAANNSDSIGTSQKFAAPTVADGEVFCSHRLGPRRVRPAAAFGWRAGPALDLTATAVSGLQINLSWVNNANNENGFAIEQSSDGVNFTQIATVITNVTTYSAETNIAAGLTYYFRVRAFNGSTNSTYSSYSNVATATTPGATPSLNYASGFSATTGVLAFNGSATLVNNRARLTNGGFNQVGAVFSATPQAIGNFTTTFTFQETNATSDGFAFVIQTAGNYVTGSPGERARLF